MRAPLVHVRRRRSVDDTVFDLGLRARVEVRALTSRAKRSDATRGFERRRVDRFACNVGARFLSWLKSGLFLGFPFQLGALARSLALSSSSVGTMQARHACMMPGTRYG